MFRKFHFFFMFLSLAVSIQLGAQTVDELIKKNIDAHGGMEKMKALKSVKMTGKASFPGGMEAPFALMKKRPNQVRIEFTLQGLTGVQAYDGTTGWQIDPFQGVKDPQKMSEDDLKDIMEQADFDGPLVDYKDKGNTVELAGKEDVQGSEAYKLKLTLKNGDVRYIFLDPDSGLDIKATTLVKRAGVDRSFDTYFGDFKAIDGVIFPMAVELKMGGDQPGPTYTVEKVETNVELQDSLFVMPAAAPQSQPSK